MASSKKEINFEELLSKTKISKVDVNDEMKKSFIAYAMAVNVSRAIPDARDGLKPVHRRILYAMSNNLGLTNDKPFRKCAKITGEVMGTYHPHGDSAIYDAIVRLAQPFSMRYTLVDGQGNFGTIDGDPAAASRYTEARLTKLSNEMLRDIDKETVDFYPNYDGTCMQPTVLPARFPNLLVNGSSGIAVGMATNIPPHNMGEVIDGAEALMNNPDITIDELMKFIPAPDFPTGGIIMGRGGIWQAYRTGQGSFILRAKTEIEEYNNGSRQRIVVTELPYQVNKSELIKTIADLAKDKKIEGIANINDESDRTGMRIVVDIKKEANAQVVLNLLFKHTNLQTSFGIIFLALLNNEPKVLNIKQLLECYVAHQRDVISRRTKFDLARAEDREHIIHGLVIAQADIDEVIRIIRASKDRNESQTRLMERFGLSEKQVNAILDMRLGRLNQLDVNDLKNELDDLEKQIADLKETLATPAKVDEIIRNEMNEIRAKYGDDRKTELSNDYGDIDLGDIIEEEKIVISATHLGYVKRQALSEYKAQRRGGVGIAAHKPKEDDYVESIFTCSTHDNLLVFTTFGKVYQMKGYDVPEAQRQARGRAVVNLLPLDLEEKVTAVIPVSDYSAGFLMMITRDGLIKKTAISEFESIRKNGKIATILQEDDSLIAVLKTSGSDELLVSSRKGKCIRISEDDVRAMGRVTKGVKAMNISEDDRIVDMIILSEEAQTLTVTENGFGKRTPLADYRLQSRAGKGVRSSVINKKTGDVVSVKLVHEDDDLMLIADDGTMIRMAAAEISVMGRDTVGVRIMRLRQGGISSVAIVPKEDVDETVSETEGEAEPAKAAVPTVELQEESLEYAAEEAGQSADDDKNDDLN